MADVRGFHGLCFNSAKIAQLADVISPPYDVISAEQKKQFLERSPYNIVRLILPEGDNPYQNAAETLDAWIKEEILRSDPEKTIYCYHQTYATPEGEEKTRKGFFALIRVTDFDQGIVLPHEATLSAPKEDRLQLLRSTRTNFCPIFGLFSDPNQSIDKLMEPFTSAPPRAKVRDTDGILNTLWAISDPEVVQQVQDLMAKHWVLIADGHHRYEASLLYRNERGATDKNPDAPFHFTLMFLCNINQPGITVLPYNRAVLNLPDYNYIDVIRNSDKYFDVATHDDWKAAHEDLKQAGAQNIAFLARFYGSPHSYLFRLKPDVSLTSFYPPETTKPVQRLDVNVLHKIFLEHILAISEEDIRKQKYLKYYKDIKEEQKDFEAGKLQIALFLNPTRVEQVVDVSRAGRKMPQKSTFFYPKVMTGFVLNKHE